jgi:hypothetical protein
MSREKTSVTEEVSDTVEYLCGGSHYQTTISDGYNSVEGVGETAEEAEQNASDAWDEQFGTKMKRTKRSENKEVIYDRILSQLSRQLTQTF